MHTQKQSIYGRAERMPNAAFRIMSLFLSGREKSAAAALTQFGIRPGDTVVDFGCGPGAYIRSASGLAGAKGRVYAVDIHPLAIKAVERKIKKYRLKNVTPVLADGYPCPLDARTADLAYALDMFHMVTRPSAQLH
jgi:ubiquinone/menaquinone biosynthesis C-methylase UbiE